MQLEKSRLYIFIEDFILIRSIFKPAFASIPAYLLTTFLLLFPREKQQKKVLDFFYLSKFILDEITQHKKLLWSHC